MRRFFNSLFNQAPVFNAADLNEVTELLRWINVLKRIIPLIHYPTLNSPKEILDLLYDTYKVDKRDATDIDRPTADLFQKINQYLFKNDHEKISLLERFQTHQLTGLNVDTSKAALLLTKITVYIGVRTEILAKKIQEKNISGNAKLGKLKIEGDIFGCLNTQDIPLIYAAAGLNLSTVVEALLTREPSLANCTGLYATTPLMFAAEHAALDSLQVLLNHGAKIDYILVEDKGMQDVRKSVIDAAIEGINKRPAQLDVNGKPLQYPPVILWLFQHGGLEVGFKTHPEFTAKFLAQRIFDNDRGPNQCYVACTMNQPNKRMIIDALIALAKEHASFNWQDQLQRATENIKHGIPITNQSTFLEAVIAHKTGLTAGKPKAINHILTAIQNFNDTKELPDVSLRNGPRGA